MAAFPLSLPACTTDKVETLLQTIDLPTPDLISFPASQGQLHQIILLTWPSDTLRDIVAKRKLAFRSDESHTSLILRVAAKGTPHIKVENEAATYIWLSRHTSIPVPQIVHHNSSDENVLGYEYTLMTYAIGEDGAKLYKTMTEVQTDYVLDQLGEHLMQLYRNELHHIGGLKTTGSGDVAPGPVIDETQWTEADIVKYWPAGTTFEDLNPTSPSGYSSYTSFLAAYMTCYIRAIGLHPALTSLPYLQDDAIVSLHRFISVISEPIMSAKLDDLPYILAHRDLHFGNLLLDPSTFRITAVLDWEFAQVVAFPLWKRCFLWSGDTTIPWSHDVFIERKGMRNRWKNRVRGMDGSKGAEMLKAQKWKFEEQRAAWDVVNYLRCVIEVVPRGTQLEDAKGWWKEVLRALAVLGIDY